MVDHILVVDPDWVKNKKATINPINQKDNKYFQYAVTAMLNHEEIGKDSERITKIKTFINKHNWNRKKISSAKDYCREFEKNNATIAFNLLYIKKEKKHILLMLQNITQIVKNKLFF